MDFYAKFSPVVDTKTLGDGTRVTRHADGAVRYARVRKTRDGLVEESGPYTLSDEVAAELRDVFQHPHKPRSGEYGSG